MKGAVNKALRNIASKKGTNEFERRLIKATFGHDLKEPKEKHAIFLMTVMHGSSIDVTPEEMLSALALRTVGTEHSYSTVMKVNIIIHRILADKLLTGKVISATRKKEEFFIPTFQKPGNVTQDDRMDSIVSRLYAEYIEAVIHFLKRTGFKSLSKDAGVTEVALEKADKKELISFLNRLQKLVELIKNQLVNKDYCLKSRLNTSYLTQIFMDLWKVYTMYFAAIEIVKNKYKKFGSKKRAQAFEHYEYFLNFTKEFSKLIQTMPCMLNIKFKEPSIYQPNPQTLEKLRKRLEKKVSAKSTKTVPQGTWMEEQKSDGSSEHQSEKYIEKFFSDRQSSLNSENFGSPQRQRSSRIEINDATHALDNLLIENAHQEVRKQYRPSHPIHKPTFESISNQMSSDSDSSGPRAYQPRRFQTCMNIHAEQNRPMY